MRAWIPALLMVLLASGGLAPARAHETADENPWDAALQDSTGEPIRLSSYRGKPVVVFYEDRQSVALNRPLKKQLWERGKGSKLEEAAHVFAIANLRAYDFFPARTIALSYVRDEEKRLGVPILVDFDGKLSAAPWELPSRSASIFMLDGEGKVRFLHAGQLPPSEYELFFKTLSALIGVELSRPEPSR